MSYVVDDDSVDEPIEDQLHFCIGMLEGFAQRAYQRGRVELASKFTGAENSLFSALAILRHRPLTPMPEDRKISPSGSDRGGTR